MSGQSNRTSLRRRSLFLVVAVLAAALIVIYWHLIAALAFAGLLIHLNRRIRHGNRRRQPAFAKNVLALSAAYAAWNSRWLSPHHAKVHANARGTWTAPDGHVESFPPDEVPF